MFLLKPIHLILRSILSLGAIFLTLDNFKQLSTFYGPYYAGQNWTLLIGNFFLFKTKSCCISFVRKCYAEQVLLKDYSLKIIAEAKKALYFYFSICICEEAFFSYVLYYVLYIFICHYLLYCNQN